MQILSPLWAFDVAVVAFVAAAVVIGVFGARLAGLVDRLADRTGLGEAIAGAVVLGGMTSLAGLVVSVVAAAEGDASLAVSNSFGGIAAQTAFIAVADLAYRPANLEHAAASLPNMFNVMLVIVLGAIVVLGAAAPPVVILGVHPVTLLLVAAYGYGLRISQQVRDDPMWQPAHTTETRIDEPDTPPEDERVFALWRRVLTLGAVVAVAGWVVGRAGISLTEATGVTGTVVGVALTAVATSLPELVTSVAAVRAGALTLAVGGIVGGNAFDMLFVAVSDVVYRGGSLYGAIDDADLFVLGWTMVLMGIVGAGLIRRERGRIGFEGIAILTLYVAGVLVTATMG